MALCKKRREDTTRRGGVVRHASAKADRIRKYGGNGICFSVSLREEGMDAWVGSLRYHGQEAFVLACLLSLTSGIKEERSRTSDGPASVSLDNLRQTRAALMRFKATRWWPRGAKPPNPTQHSTAGTSESSSPPPPTHLTADPRTLPVHKHHRIPNNAILRFAPAVCPLTVHRCTASPASPPPLALAAIQRKPLVCPSWTLFKVRCPRRSNNNNSRCGSSHSARSLTPRPIY